MKKNSVEVAELSPGSLGGVDVVFCHPVVLLGIELVGSGDSGTTVRVCVGDPLAFVIVTSLDVTGTASVAVSVGSPLWSVSVDTINVSSATRVTVAVGVPLASERVSTTELYIFNVVVTVGVPFESVSVEVTGGGAIASVIVEVGMPEETCTITTIGVSEDVFGNSVPDDLVDSSGFLPVELVVE